MYVSTYRNQIWMSTHSSISTPDYSTLAIANELSKRSRQGGGCGSGSAEGRGTGPGMSNRQTRGGVRVCSAKWRQGWNRCGGQSDRAHVGSGVARRGLLEHGVSEPGDRSPVEDLSSGDSEVTTASSCSLRVWSGCRADAEAAVLGQALTRGLDVHGSRKFEGELSKVGLELRACPRLARQLLDTEVPRRRMF